MAGIKALRKILIGQETTAGTAVPTTVVWRGNGTSQDVRPGTVVDEDIGNLTGDTRTYVGKTEGQLTMEDTPATFEHLPYLFAAGVENLVTGVIDTPASGYVYQYDMASTASATPRTFTIEAGDNQQFEEMAYCYTQGIRLSGAPGEAVMMSADWVGRQLAPTTVTSVGVAVVEEILFGKGGIYIDTIGGTVGDTVKTLTLMGFNLSIDTGQRPVYSADGELFFATIKQIAPEVTLNVTFEHNATAVAEVVKWRAQTPGMLQLNFAGAAVETTGGTYDTKTLILRFAGLWESFDKIAEIDGNDVITGTLRARSNAANTKNSFQAIIVNNAESLT